MKAKQYSTDEISYERAQGIVSGYTENERYLRNLVANFTSGKFADGLDYSKLLPHGRRILGVAKRVLRTRPKTQERTSTSPGVEKTVQDKIVQGSLF